MRYELQLVMKQIWYNFRLFDSSMRLFYLFFLFFMLLHSRAYAQNMNWEYEANHQDDITTIVFSPDAKYIITGSWDESIIIQKNDSTREIIQQIHKNRGAVKSIAFSRDGYHMLTGGQDGKLNVFEFDGLKSKPVSLDTTYDVNACQINQLLYGPSMRSIYSAGDDGRFIVIDLIRDRIIPIKTTRPISAAAIAIDQMSYFIAHENKTEIQQLDVMGRKIRSFNGHQDQITDIEVSVDRKHLITSSKDKTVRLWNIKTGKQIHQFQDHSWTVTDISCDPMGLYLVSGSLDGTVQLYDLKNKKQLQSYHLTGYKVNAISISPDCTSILAAAHQEEDNKKSGYFILPTNLSYHPVLLPEKYILQKKIKIIEPKPFNIKSKINMGRNTIHDENNTADKAFSKPKPNEKVIKRTDQIEIRIEQ